MKKRWFSILVAALTIIILAVNANKVTADIPIKEAIQTVAGLKADVQNELGELEKQEQAQANTSEPQHAESGRITMEYAGIQYPVHEVDGGDLSGKREALVAVDVGYGDRTYWAFTNEYGQLVAVTAQNIILQDETTEPVTKDGRYYPDEAKVPGTEAKDLDEGHVIADSLGGVSNAYNITPQDSILNRYGDQAYMEKNIRDAGGCTDFVAIITYPDIKTQTPCHYHYEYTLLGNRIVEDFDNQNPET